jgi:hypothetical protein
MQSDVTVTLSANSSPNQNPTSRPDTLAMPSARRGVRAACVAAALLWIATPVPAGAALLTFDFTGTVQLNERGILFPAKNVGDSYSGSFTLDTNALQTFLNPGGTTADYTGAFNVTIESVPYSVTRFTVFSGGSDGFEFGFGSGSNVLTLRSSADIYSSPAVPTEVDLAEMDALARVESVSSTPFPAFTFDRGSITALTERVLQQVPEPATALLLGAGFAAGLISRRRKQTVSSH